MPASPSNLPSREDVFVVIANEVKQSHKDWIAASLTLLAMTSCEDDAFIKKGGGLSPPRLIIPEKNRYL